MHESVVMFGGRTTVVVNEAPVERLSDDIFVLRRGEHTHARERARKHARTHRARPAAAAAATSSPPPKLSASDLCQYPSRALYSTAPLPS